VDREGNLIWKLPVASYTGVPSDFARARPAVVGDLLILGNQAGKFLGAGFERSDPSGAKVFAVDKHTGELRWTSQVDDTAMSYVTHSAIAANGLVIVGVASNEELVAGFIPKEYWNWQFRGSVVALNAQTGAILWRTYTVPEGYYGGAVWGSTGAIDLERSVVYMATGNNYWVPQSVYDCLNNKGTPKKCMSADKHFNSIVAMDLATGAIKWARRGLPHDVWTVGCGLFVPGFTIPPNNNCPERPGLGLCTGPCPDGADGGHGAGGRRTEKRQVLGFPC
jgi:polyvinyl alcohol dehydrogenase (cytochrome)